MHAPYLQEIGTKREVILLDSQILVMSDVDTVRQPRTMERMGFFLAPSPLWSTSTTTTHQSRVPYLAPDGDDGITSCEVTILGVRTLRPFGVVRARSFPRGRLLWVAV